MLSAQTAEQYAINAQYTHHNLEDPGFLLEQSRQVLG